MNPFMDKNCVCVFIILMFFSTTVVSTSHSVEGNLGWGNEHSKEHCSATLSFTFEDIEQLWKIIDELKSGSDPAVEQWSSLVSGSGYKSLIKEEIPKDILLEAIRTAFSPSKKKQKTLWQEEDKPALRLVEHFSELDSKRREIEAFLLQLNHEQSKLSQQAVAMACSYFSLQAIKGAPRFSVAFAAFQKDARGYSSSIVVDPLFALEAGDNLLYWLAHETHHILRHTVSVETSTDGEIAKNKSLVWVLNQLQSEGIADQIDKPHTFFEDGYLARSKFAEFFKNEVVNAPTRIAQFDVLIQELEDCQFDCEAVGDRMRKVAVMAGHPLGFFMAESIEQAFGREALIADIGNPARFLVSYNEAALKSASELPVFSEKSIKYVSSLFTGKVPRLSR